MRTFLFLCGLTLTSLLSAQAGNLKKADREALTTKVTELNALTETIYTDANEEKRFQACKDLIRGLVAALKTKNSFNFPFTDLNGVKILEAPDRSFRVFTWELFVDRDDYRHYGAIQMNEKALNLVPLVDRGDWLQENPENAQMGADKWLGYVAYKIVA
ncbi:MAG: hypothetical protein AAFN92_22240, partial [Bacteroidota bacterium]